MSPQEIVNPAIEAYLLGLAPDRSAVQQQIEADPPAAIVGPLEGQVLYLLARLSGARRVLEVGTATGYSGLWLLKALAGVDGRLITIERDAQRAQIAQENFRRAGYGDLVEVRNGDAFAVLETLSGSFDLIFVDILRNLTEPHLAQRLLELCTPLLRAGGLFVADNVLVNGEVIEPNPSDRVQGILDWNRRVSMGSEFESIIIPLRDGITISRKIEGA